MEKYTWLLCGNMARKLYWRYRETGVRFPPGLFIKMTTIKEVELGEDIKKMFNKCSCAHNETNINIEKLDNDELYLIEKHIGFYEPKQTSGIFILNITELTEEYLMSNF